MLPNLVTLNKSYCLETDTKLLSNSSLNNAFGNKGSYFKNVFRRELGIVSSFATLHISAKKTSFFRSISHIIKLSSKKKMGRPYARPIIALVKHKHIFWYFSKRDLPTYPVGQGSASFRDFSTSNRKTAISYFLTISLPLPAVGGFLNLTPKSFGGAL